MAPGLNPLFYRLIGPHYTLAAPSVRGWTPVLSCVLRLMVCSVSPGGACVSCTVTNEGPEGVRLQRVGIPGVGHSQVSIHPSN